MTLNGIIMLLFPHEIKWRNRIKSDSKNSSFFSSSEKEITNLRMIKIIIHMLLPSELLYRTAICAGFVNIWSKAGFVNKHKGPPLKEMRIYEE